MIFAGNNLLHAVLLSMVALFATTPALGSELALGSEFATGCESSAFAEQRISTLKVLAGNKAKISVAHRIHPIDNQLCIVASTWLSANKSDSISIDVAIYQQSTQAKIAEFTTSISEQQVWFEPEIEIVSSQFPVSHNSKAFGVAVSWEFLAELIVKQRHNLCCCCQVATPNCMQSCRFQSTKAIAIEIVLRFVMMKNRAKVVFVNVKESILSLNASYRLDLVNIRIILI